MYILKKKPLCIENIIVYVWNGEKVYYIVDIVLVNLSYNYNII